MVVCVVFVLANCAFLPLDLDQQKMCHNIQHCQCSISVMFCHSTCSHNNNLWCAPAPELLSALALCLLRTTRDCQCRCANVATRTTINQLTRPANNYQAHSCSLAACSFAQFCVLVRNLILLSGLRCHWNHTRKNSDWKVSFHTQATFYSPQTVELCCVVCQLHAICCLL